MEVLGLLMLIYLIALVMVLLSGFESLMGGKKMSPGAKSFLQFNFVIIFIVFLISLF